MTARILFAAACLSLAIPFPVAHADDVPEAVRSAARSAIGIVDPRAFRPSGLPGFFEVRGDGEIFYISGDGRFLVHGNLYDLEARRNLTEEARRDVRLDIVDRIDEDTLIVFAPPKVRHTLTVFTDVDCPYCVKFHREIPELNARGVSVRYAAWPRAEPGTESYRRNVAVWCARDQRKAMTDAKEGRRIALEDCENPVREHFEAGRRVGVRGTPTIVTDRGDVIGGYMPYAELVRSLEKG